MSNLPSELLVFLAAMLPVGELRLAIPLGLTTYDLSWERVFFLSVVGNILVAAPIIWGLDVVSRRLQSFPNPLGHLLRRYCDYITGRHGRRLQTYGVLGLASFVAIPLPMTGAWTGAFLAWALQLPRLRAFLAIALGVVIAGIVVTALTVTGQTIWGILS